MKAKQVIVLPYDKNWKDEFDKIKMELEKVIGNDIIAIEHVGSTSVEGLAAKPIIDVDIIIDIVKFDIIKSKLKTMRYIHEGDLGVLGREAFKYENKNHLMKHHLYVCHKNSEELNRHIVFRDWLRNNSEDREMYSKIKLEMAKMNPDNIDSYIRGKTPCVVKIYMKCGLLTNTKPV